MERNTSLSHNNQNEHSSANPEAMNYYGSFIFPIFTLLLAITCLATAIYTIIYNIEIFKNNYIPEYLFVSGIVLLMDFTMMVIQSIFRKNDIICRSKLLSRIVRWILFIGYSSLIIIGFIFCFNLDNKITNSANSELSIAFFSTYCFIVFRAVIEIVSFIILKALQRNDKKKKRMLNIDTHNSEEILNEVITRDASPVNTHRKLPCDINCGEQRNVIYYQEDNENGIAKNIDSNLNSRNTSFREGESRFESPEAKSEIELNNQNEKNAINKSKGSGENLTSTHSSSNLAMGTQLPSPSSEIESCEIKLFGGYKQEYEDRMIPSANLTEEYQEPELINYETEVDGYFQFPKNMREIEEMENFIVRTLQTSEHEKTNSSINLSHQDKTF